VRQRAEGITDDASLSVEPRPIGLAGLEVVAAFGHELLRAVQTLFETKTETLFGCLYLITREGVQTPTGGL